MAKRKSRVKPQTLDTPEKPPEPVAAQPVKTPVPAVKPPDPEKPLVQLRVFLKIAGPKPDQMAGFGSYAKRMGMGPMTALEWRDKLVAFGSKPIK